VGRRTPFGGLFLIWRLPRGGGISLNYGDFLEYVGGCM